MPRVFIAFPKASFRGGVSRHPALLHEYLYVGSERRIDDDEAVSRKRNSAAPSLQDGCRYFVLIGHTAVSDGGRRRFCFN